jgi:hypothetical protein
MTGELTRTPEEIVAEVNRLGEDSWSDWMGTKRGDMIEYLPYDLAKPFLKDGVGPEDWPDQEKTPFQLAKEYMDFAIGKCTGHRGISAGRSVEHFQAWFWLAGEEASVDWDEYANYGAPVLKKVAELIGFNWPDEEGLNRMAQGLRCTPDCQDGCGA